MVGVIEPAIELLSPDSAAAGESLAIYKEVVVIGNGPSGIVMSYFLAGNWPYYNGLGEEVNEMLHYRLVASGGGVNTKQQLMETDNSTQTSLIEQDLIFLSQVRTHVYIV